MLTLHRYCIRAVALGIFLAAPGLAQAQGKTPISKDELARLLDLTLPPVIGRDNRELVGKLLKPRMAEKPWRGTFDLGRAVQAIFGRQPPAFSPECQRLQTPVGEPEQEDCVAQRGNEGGTGGYVRFSFSRNLGVGNMSLLIRPADRDLRPEDLVPVKLTDTQAYESAQSFLKNTLGLDLVETSQPPPDAKTLPVSSLNIGFPPESQIPPITVQKAVHLKRGFAVEGVGDPQTGLLLPYIPAPGMATVLLEDAGVVGVMVEDWQELVVDPKMDPAKAKSRQELIDEIADDLSSEDLVDLAKLSATLVLSSDWRGTHGLLLPAVQVFVSPVKRDLDEEEQNRLEGVGTAGFVREYALVNRAQEELEER